MNQRAIFDVVVQGLAAFIANPQIYTDLFGRQWGLSDTEVAGIAATFAKFPPTVRHGYSLADVKMPLVVIMLQNEEQSDYAMGNYVGQNTFLGPAGNQMRAAELGSIWRSSFQILCLSENIDTTSYLYEMVKTSLIIGKAVLEARGIMSPELSGGDLGPDSRYGAEHLFARTLMLSCKRQFVVTDFENALAVALTIDGLAAPALSPHSNGNVMANVTLYSVKARNE
jgi:hypothetical protein